MDVRRRMLVFHSATMHAIICHLHTIPMVYREFMEFLFPELQIGPKCMEDDCARPTDSFGLTVKQNRYVLKQDAH